MTRLVDLSVRIFGPDDVASVKWLVRCRRCDGAAFGEHELEVNDRGVEGVYSCPRCHQTLLIVRPEDGAADRERAPRSLSEQGYVVYAESDATIHSGRGRIEVKGNGLPPA